MSCPGRKNCAIATEAKFHIRDLRRHYGWKYNLAAFVMMAAGVVTMIFTATWNFWDSKELKQTGIPALDNLSPNQLFILIIIAIILVFVFIFAKNYLSSHTQKRTVWLLKSRISGIRRQALIACKKNSTPCGALHLKPQLTEYVALKHKFVENQSKSYLNTISSAALGAGSSQ